MSDVDYKKKVGELRRTIVGIVKLAADNNSTASIANSLKPFIVYDKDFTEENYLKYFEDLSVVVREMLGDNMGVAYTQGYIYLAVTLKVLNVQFDALYKGIKEIVDNLFGILSKNEDIVKTHKSNRRIGSMASVVVKTPDEWTVQRIAIIQLIMYEATESEELQSRLNKVHTMDETFSLFNAHIAELRKAKGGVAPE